MFDVWWEQLPEINGLIAGLRGGEGGEAAQELVIPGFSVYLMGE